MPKPRACHLPMSSALFCISFEHLGQAKSLQGHGVNIVISNSTELEGRR